MNAGAQTRAIVALLVAAVLSSLTPTTADADDNAALPETLLVLHDSVLAHSQPKISAALPEVDVRYLGFPGVRVAAAVDLVRDNRHLIGDKVIVELGYNYFQRPNRKLFRQDIDALMAELGNVDHVIWMTVTELSKRLWVVNQELRRAAHRWPNLQIADWSPVTLADTSLTHEDGYHLNQNGSAVFADFVRGHLNHASDWNRIPTGRFRISNSGAGHQVTGWAFDPDLGKPARVRIVVDGKVARRVTATRDKAAVARTLGARHGVGFVAIVSLSPGTHRVCIEVNNFDGLQPVSLQCRKVRVP